MDRPSSDAGPQTGSNSQQGSSALKAARFWNTAIWLTALAAGYTALACIGLQWARFDGAGSPVWPAAGLALAGLILGGPSLWPAIVVGRLAAAFMTGSEQPLYVEVGIACGNALSAYLPALALRRMRISASLDNLHDLLRYLIYGAGLGGVISGAIGAGLISLTSGLSMAASWDIFIFWATGSFVGVVTLGPVIQLGLIIGPQHVREGLPPIQVAAPCVMAAIASWVIFCRPDIADLRPWHVIPFMIWPALSGRPASAISLATMATFAVWGAVDGLFFFGAEQADLATRISLLQQFIAVVGVTILSLGVVASDRQRASQANLRLALMGADQGVMNYNVARKLITWDARSCAHYGISETQSTMPIDAMLQLIHADDRIIVSEALHRALDPSGSGLLDVEHRVATPDGEPIWVALKGQTTFAGVARLRTPVSIRGVTRDITEEKRSQQQLVVLSKEVAHRAKNQLAVIQSIASRSLRGDVSLDDAREAFVGRLHTMSNSFDLLNAAAMGQVALYDIVNLELTAFADQYSAEGPDVQVRSAAVQPIALLLHELATNASKYGALSLADGDIRVSWTIDADTFTLEWVEMWDMPPSAAQTAQTTGFGTVLLQRLLPLQLSGEASHVYGQNGLQYRLTCPIAKITGPENPQF